MKRRPLFLYLYGLILPRENNLSKMREATEKYRNDESNEDDEHLSNMRHGVNPYFTDNTIACHHLDKGPKDDDCGKGVAYASAPRLDAHLTTQHKDGCHEGKDADNKGDRVA